MKIWIAERRLLERAVADAVEALLAHQWDAPVWLPLARGCIVAARNPDEVRRVLHRDSR